MDDELYNSIYLTETELLLLLTQTGTEEMQGLLRMDPETVSRESLTKAMFSLYERGLITTSDGKNGSAFEAEPYLGRIIRLLTSAENKTEKEGRMIYSGKETVIAEPCPEGEGDFAFPGEGTLRLYIVSTREDRI